MASALGERSKKARVRWVAVVMAFLISTVLGACGSSSGDSSVEADAKGVRTVKIGLIPSMTVSSLYLGIKKGFFEEVKLEIEPILGTGGAAELPKLMTNQIQVAYGGVIALMLAQQQGLPVKAVANGGLTVEPGKPVPDRVNGVLFVAKDSGIKSAKDLSGKTVAVNALKNLEEVLTRNSIDRAGGNSSKVNFIEMPTSGMLPALDAGRIDAALVFEPTTTIARAQGFEALLRPFVSLDHPASNISVWFTSEQLLEQDPKLIADFQKGMNKSLAYARTHPDEARAIVDEYTDISPELIDRATLPYWATEVNVASITEIADLAVKYKVLSKQPDLEKLLSYAPH